MFDVADVAAAGDGSRFSFDPELPGPGDYVAVLEFAPDTGGVRDVEFDISVDDQGRQLPC